MILIRHVRLKCQTTMNGQSVNSNDDNNAENYVDDFKRGSVVICEGKPKVYTRTYLQFCEDFNIKVTKEIEQVSAGFIHIEV